MEISCQIKKLISLPISYALPPNQPAHKSLCIAASSARNLAKFSTAHTFFLTAFPGVLWGLEVQRPLRILQMNNKRAKIYEGKAKILYEGPEPGTVVVHYKDDATAGNGEKKAVIEGKGVLNQRISEFLFQKINELGLPTHFIRSLNMREQLVREVEIIPLEVVVRNVAAGSLSKRLGLEEGSPLPRAIIELFYKNDKLNDPMVTEEHVTAFGWASPQEMDDIVHMSIRINDFLSGLFLGIGIKLVDFKLEFGRYFENDMMRIVLADEISPDNCRLWDIATKDKLDKDRFRRDMGGLVEAYHEVARRLGIIQPNETPERSKPKLVKTD
jgi:phosphoribosylaminoimidazole-succinocarboxamide synthase